MKSVVWAAAGRMMSELAAAVKVSVRRVYLRMASGYPLKGLFAVVLARLSGRPGAAAPVGSPSG